MQQKFEKGGDYSRAGPNDRESQRTREIAFTNQPSLSNQTNYKPNQFSRNGERTNTIPTNVEGQMAQRSYNHDTYARDGYSGYERKRQEESFAPRNADPAGIPGPGGRHKAGNFERKILETEKLDEIPRDCTVTLKCGNVPNNFNGGELQRSLANSGFRILDFKFKHDILTGERAGDGTIHVRYFFGF